MLPTIHSQNGYNFVLKEDSDLENHRRELNSFSPAPIDSMGTLEWLPAPAPIGPMGTESLFQETSLTLQKYAYL